MAREVSIAHSRSILDRQRHVMSIGLENQALFHYDINSNDALDRYKINTSILNPLKWEFISGSSGDVTVNNDGSILVTGVTGSFIIASTDYIEIQPDQKYYLGLALLNVNDPDESHAASVGTINYTDLYTKITQGRPSGTDYDNWVINNDSINFDDTGNNVIQWHPYNNNAIQVYEYKSGESGTPTELHKWPTGTRYARIFIKLDTLVPADQIMIRDLNMFFRDEAGIYTNVTPGYTLIDAYDGRFGGGMDMAGGGGTNLVWNGDLRYGLTDWSVGVQGSGSVTATLDDDGSYKVYFSEVQDVRNVVQIDMPQAIVDNTEYTLSFYARAARPMGFRRISVIDPATQNVGWSAEEIIYFNSTWQKFTATATSDFSTGTISRLVITEPDVLEPETLFVYYNGILLSRGTDYVELNNYNLQLDFNIPASDNDILNIYTQNTAGFVVTAYVLTFHSAVPAGNVVAIRHFTEVADTEAITAVEEIYEISGAPATLNTGNYVADTPNYLHVFRNGQLLTEGVDYTTSVVVGIIKISFAYSLLTGDSIKVVFWKNMSMSRNNYTAAGTLNEQFDLPTGETYTTDAAHMMVFENGILLAEGGGNDYIEVDSNTIQYNGTPGAGNTISLMPIANTYEFSIDSWTLISNEAQFAYTPESVNVFRFTTVNGTAMSKDYDVWVNDYVEGVIGEGDSFYYERYDLPAVVVPGQTVFAVPGGYDANNDLQVYRNGILLTRIDDYTRQQPAGTVTLTVPTVLGELMTMFRIIMAEATGPNASQYVREDYTLDEGITTYNTSQAFGVGDDSLRIFINGILQRVDLDYTEDDVDTVTLVSPFNTGDAIALVINIPLGSDVTSVYARATYYGTDIDSNNVLNTPAISLNYVEDTTGTVWIKNVKLGEGKPYTDSYHPGVIASGNLQYEMDIDELESTLTFQMKPYDIDLANGFIDWQGEVANYAALPGGPSVGEVYRTEDTYKYYEWDGSVYNETYGPTVFSLLYGSSWDLMKIERIFGETSKFRAIVGEPNNYNVITIPEMSSDDWTMITASWTRFGTQWYQTEYDTFASLPTLTGSETGYVYKVADTGYYYIWDGDSWEPKAPDGLYDKYTDLPTLTAIEDGYAAEVDEEPELYNGEVANYASLPMGYTVSQSGRIYKTTDTGFYYIWDWDYVENTGNWRKITPGYFYQWNWDPVTQSGSWVQSNKIKIYINDGTGGIYTKSYHPVINQPDGLIVTSNLYGKIDELRVDRIARDPKEIAAWYNSQSPFYPSGDVALVV